MAESWVPQRRLDVAQPLASGLGPPSTELGTCLNDRALTGIACRDSGFHLLYQQQHRKIECPPQLLWQPNNGGARVRQGLPLCHHVPLSSEAPPSCGQQRLPERFLPPQPASDPWGPSWTGLQRPWPFLSGCQDRNRSWRQFSQPHGWKECPHSLNCDPLLIYMGATVRRPPEDGS